MVNGATVTATDVPTSNGIIHVIDKVLTPTPTPNDIPHGAVYGNPRFIGGCSGAG